MGWINAIMTATGYVWWGVILGCAVIYGVILILEQVKNLFKRRKDSFYYDKPIGKMVSVKEDKDGISVEGFFFGPDAKPDRR